jgi:hypothetical protein
MVNIYKDPHRDSQFHSTYPPRRCLFQILENDEWSTMLTAADCKVLTSLPDSVSAAAIMALRRVGHVFCTCTTSIPSSQCIAIEPEPIIYDVNKLCTR